MTIIFSLLSIAWSMRIVLNSISFAHLWWVKEYRWDRMWIHLRTPQGKWVYLLPFRRPRISPKSLTFIACMILGEAYFIYRAGSSSVFTFFIADLLSFPMTFLVVAVLNIPVGLYHRWIIYRARLLLQAHKTLTVIGITGSFGKTSTKEYLASILATQYKTLKTQASKNSPIGIAEVVVSSLTDRYEAFVVEMGAYKRGEIAYMSRMVRPEIAIVTAINAQHQDLFGSIDNTMRAKYELVSGLTGRRIAIMNADDTRVRTMGEWAQKDGVSVWWVGTRKPFPPGTRACIASNITAAGGNLQFACELEKQTANVSVPLYGTHHVINVLAAIAAAVACGMPFVDACKAAKTIKPAAHTLAFVRGRHATFIDDTFNNNPDAAMAAIDVLGAQKGKKYLVFQPMIELGKFAQESHRNVGSYAARICDAVILTNASWSQDFIQGVRRISKDLPVNVYTAKEAARYIRAHVHTGDTVLFKGKESAKTLDILTSRS